MTTQMLPIERDDAGPFAGVVTVRLDQPGRSVVVLDRDLIEALEQTLRSVPRDARGLVLASASERVFVAGADLHAVQDLDDDALHKYLQYGSRVFAMLAAFPFPTAAAINGAALGGGLEIAMHCDGLIGAPAARAYPVGLPEAGLSICPGWGGTNLLPARMDPAAAIRMTAEGKPVKFDEAVAAGLFDAVAESADALLDTAKRWVIDKKTPERDGMPSRWCGRGSCAAGVLKGLDGVRSELPETEAATAVASAVEAGVTNGWDAALDVEQRELVRLRRTEAAVSAISSFFERSKK